MPHPRDLGRFADEWSGWTVDGELIVTPEGDRYSVGDIRAIRYRREQLRELERQLAQPQQWLLL